MSGGQYLLYTPIPARRSLFFQLQHDPVLWPFLRVKNKTFRPTRVKFVKINRIFSPATQIWLKFQCKIPKTVENLQFFRFYFQKKISVVTQICSTPDIPTQTKVEYSPPPTPRTCQQKTSTIGKTCKFCMSREDTLIPRKEPETIFIKKETIPILNRDGGINFQKHQV